MKREYENPEFKYYRVTLEDVILGSLEDPIGEVIVGDDDGGGEDINLDF